MEEWPVARSHGHIKPVGKDRKILSIGFKSILFPKVHCGNNMGNGSVG